MVEERPQRYHEKWSQGLVFAGGAALQGSVQRLYEKEIVSNSCSLHSAISLIVQKLLTPTQ